MRYWPAALVLAVGVASPICPRAGAEPLAVPACVTSQLAPALGTPEGAAGTTYYPLNLRNTGSAPCSISGYPAVVFVDGAGNPVGAAATNDPDTVGVVVLDPGQSASANLGIVNAGNFPADCATTPVNGLLVTPPGQTDSVTVDHADTACANSAYGTLHVGLFTGA